MISLIIPMYNSEETIRKTLASVIEQTVAFSEVIVVDNGSSDNSVQIVSEICQQYPYIHLFHCQQQGVSAARNMGIEMTKSPYISFLDSDDLLAKDYVEIIRSSITSHPDAEMYHFNFQQEFKSGIIKKNSYFLHGKEVYSGSQFMEETLKHFSFEAKHMVWSFVFKTEFLKQYNLQFNTEIPIFEDILFLHKVWNENPEIIIINKILVTYLYNERSITNTKKQSDYLQVMIYLNTQLKALAQSDYLKKIASRVLTIENYCEFSTHTGIRGVFPKKISYIKLNVFYLNQRIRDKIKGVLNG